MAFVKIKWLFLLEKTKLILKYPYKEMVSISVSNNHAIKNMYLD